MMHGLYSRRVLINGRLREGVVVIDRGLIGAIESTPPPSLPVEDLGDWVLMPALVDTHVHINEPGRTDWEGFETATKAAAVGGITTLVDMPLNCTPVTTTEAALRTKVEAATPQLHVDTAFWGGVVPGNAEDLEDLCKAGIVGAKAFLCYSGIDDFPMSDARTLREAMPVLAKYGVPLLVHAELEGPTTDDGRSSPTDYQTFLRSRPPKWEVDAIKLVIDLVRETGCAAHIVHLSAAAALPLLERARAEGLPITVETCPHYLCLTAEQIRSGETEFKCCPPIRDSHNRDRLWDGLRDGTIDIVVSDHSPCTPHLKLPDEGDFMEAWGGIASLQLGLSAVWTEARARGFTVADVARWMSAAPARLIDQDLRRGRISVGYRADLVAWDPDDEWQVDAANLFHKNKITPYDGKTLRGRVHATWLRGDKVAAGGHIISHPLGHALLKPR